MAGILKSHGMFPGIPFGSQVSAANAQIQTAVAQEKDALERCRERGRPVGSAVRCVSEGDDVWLIMVKNGK